MNSSLAFTVMKLLCLVRNNWQSENNAGRCHYVLSLTLLLLGVCRISCDVLLLQVETYKEGQRILERQRFQFPTTWLYSDNVEGEWGAFSEIIRRKDASIQTQVASLQMKIVTEDKVVENKTTDLLSEWDKEKPVEVGGQKIVCS